MHVSSTVYSAIHLFLSVFPYNLTGFQVFSVEFHA